MGVAVQKRVLRNKLMVRFNRLYPGEGVVLRNANEQLGKRSVHVAQKTRVVASETARVHTFGSKAMSVRVEASPNAPLLKRMVLHPFALSVGFFKRTPIEGLGDSWKMPKRERTVVASELTKLGRSKISAQNPISALVGVRRTVRVRPSVDSWLQRSGDE